MNASVMPQPKHRSGRARAVVHLAGGASVAQAVPLLAAPFLARLYSPSDYAALALFMMCGTVWGTVASGRFHLAILLPSEDHAAFKVLRLALGVTFTSSLLATVALVAFPHILIPGDWRNVLGGWLYAAPAVGALMSLYDCLTTAALRFGLTRRIGESAVGRAATSTAVQLGIGLASIGSGLMMGSVAGSAAGNVRLASALRRTAQLLPRTESARTSLQYARRYRRFPLVDTPGALLNSLSNNFIVAGIALLYSANQLGQYALASRLLVLPAAVVGTAIGQVFTQRLAESRRREDSKGSEREYLRTLALLLAMALPTFGLLIPIGPSLFTLAFGSQWRFAGELASLLAPIVVIRFVASPLSAVFTVYERQVGLLIIQISLALGSLMCFWAAWARDWSIQSCLLAQSAVTAGIYVVAIYRGLSITRTHRSEA